MLRLATAGSLHTSAPCTDTDPPSGRSSPVTIDRVVVFPAPFGPTIPKMLPAGTDTLMWSTATVPPNRFTSPETTSTTSLSAIASWAVAEDAEGISLAIDTEGVRAKVGAGRWVA